ncbi:MAG TPA: CDP-alcohol phosphatidyltransferase family protein [Gammaproteobacteria bacterium]
MQKTIPNVLSIIRLACVPVLVWLAWTGRPHWFLAVLVFAFATDAIDGFIARRFDLKTALGAKLDSYADAAIYLTLAASVFRLWPDIVATEKVYILLIVFSVVTPAAAGLLKFRLFTSYHTWLTKFAVVCTAVTTLTLLLGGPAWPFRIVSVLCVIAALEEILITVYLPKPKSNVRSIWHLKNKEI